MPWLGVASIVLLLPLTTAPQTVHDYRQPPAVSQFIEQVNGYVELHRLIAAGLGPEALCSDPEILVRQQRLFADAIRRERPSWRTGEIFTPDAAAFFRDRILEVLRETRGDVHWTHHPPDDDGREVDALAAGDAFPWHDGSVMWPAMLWRLPTLPDELEYRFIGRTLALVDVRASLIVDLLPDALPLAGPATPAGSPCDVHPELPACWM